MPNPPRRPSGRVRKSPVPWGLVIVAVGITLLAPVWLMAALWLGAGWQDNAWETRCYAGQPAFALGQASVAIIGLSLGTAGMIGTVRTVRRRRRPGRRPYLLFAGVALAFGAWLTVVVNQPETRAIAGAYCFVPTD